MPKLHAVNDYFMVELESNPQGFIDNINVREEGVMSGKVVDISDEMTYFGFNTFMFDSSLLNTDVLSEIHKHYSQYVGKRVWWPMRTESGAIIEQEGKQYVFIKMSALMAVEED